MVDQSLNELLIVSALWALCVVLYYFAGKKRGWADGYEKGVTDGHKHVLAAMSATSDLIQENKPMTTEPPIETAISLLKELRDTTPIVTQRKRIDAFLAVNHDVQREIPLNRESDIAFDLYKAMGFLDGLQAIKILEWLRPHLRTTEPVSGSPVSLMYCTERLRDKFATSWNSREINCKWEDLAKVVLDQAGVQYVD